MSPTRHVFLDPDGMAGDESWLYVIVAAGTGVVYQHQYGGTACRQGRLEGYLVPVAGGDVLADLRDLFERHFRGTGTWNYRWADDERARLRAAVAEVTYWASDGWDYEPYRLSWDETVLADTDEAWVPVRTPDGPGVLVWANSD